MRNQKLAFVAFFLNPILWALFYVIGKKSIDVSDPVLFSTIELLTTIPFAGIVLFLNRKHVNRITIRAGIYTGISLYFVVLMSAMALAYSSATETAFFPALNGINATIILFMISKEKIKPTTWIGGLVAAFGVCIVLPIMHEHLTGNILALGAAIAYTLYLFVAEKMTQGHKQSQWVIFAMELFIMVIFGILTTCLWSVSHHLDFEPFAHASMIKSVIFVGIATTFIPTAISILFQQSIKPVTIAFIYSFEPIWCACLAFLLLGERLPFLGYFGGFCIVAGAFFHTL